MRNASCIFASVLLLGGCSAWTNFDYTLGDAGTVPADGGADAGPDAAVDSGPGSMDGGADAGPGDGGPDPMDGGGFPGCIAPCAGDLDVDYAEGEAAFGDAQWRFVEDPRQALGTTYPPMAFESGANVYRNGATSIGRCLGAECPARSFRMVGPARGAGSDPVIELSVSMTGTYTLGGGAVALGSGSGELLVSRDNRADAMARIELAATEAPSAISAQIFLVAGDHVRVALRPADGSLDGVEAAVALWIAGPHAAATPTCEGAVDFDTWPGPVSQFGGWDVELTQTAGTMLPTQLPSAAMELGTAVRVASATDTYVRFLGSLAMDLSGDFTIQLWARREDTGGSSLEALLTNINSVEFMGGVSLDYDPPRGDILLTVFDQAGTELARHTGYEPGATWHFYRIVRSGDVVQLCIDGVAQGQVTARGDLTANRSVTLGRFGTQGVFFTGELDEVRVITEALPCEAAP